MRVKVRVKGCIRTISFVLMITFILQDIVYADPDVLLKSSTLAPRTIQTSGNKPESLVRYTMAHFDDIASKDPNPRLETIQRAAEAQKELL